MGVHQEHTKKQNKSKNYLKIGGKVKKGHKNISHSERREKFNPEKCTNKQILCWKASLANFCMDL